MKMADLTARLVGRPYRLGQMDCFALVLEWLRLRGLEPLGAWEGWTLADYADVFRADPDGAKCLQVAYFDAWLEPIAPARAFAGDVLAVTTSGASAPFLAVHGGNGHLLTCDPERGVTLYPLAGYEIVRAWACRRP